MRKLTGWIFILTLLNGCSRGLLDTVGPDYQPETPPLPEQWQANLGHEQDLVASAADVQTLQEWWHGFHDPVLDELLAAAQTASSNVAQAQAQIMAARADLTTAVAAALPNLDSNLGASSTAFSFGGPVFNRNQFFVGAQSSWEIDLFGGLARQHEATGSRLAAKVADLRAAKVSVAAETANAYLAFRHCERLTSLAERDAAARVKAAELVEIAGKYGLRASADVALSRSGAADAEDLLRQRRLQCQQAVKALTALTAMNEALVRSLLQKQAGILPQPPVFKLDSLPAQVIMQRPDVASAERSVAEASALVGVQEATRYPKLTLTGNIAYAMQNISPSPLALAQTWSIGPTFTLPIFDAGKRAANVEAAKAQYAAAAASFRATTRQAVREVEEALLRLHSATERLPDVQQAVAGYRQNVKASDDLYRVGLGSLLAVEENRRSAIAAETTLATLQQERVSAWIALYRAVGGGWQDEQQAVNH